LFRVIFRPQKGQRKLFVCLFENFSDDFVGKVFKVTHDKQRGALSLVRIFRGELKAKGARITTASGASENVQRLYEPLADEYREVTECGAGNIVVCGGLKVRPPRKFQQPLITGSFHGKTAGKMAKWNLEICKISIFS
jgi:translation elongation factor EF-G